MKIINKLINNNTLNNEELLYDALLCENFLMLKNLLKNYNNINDVIINKGQNNIDDKSYYICGHNNLLLWAVKNGSFDLINFLLNQGIYIDVQNYSVFIYLAKIGNLKLLDYLLTYHKKIKFSIIWKNSFHHNFLKKMINSIKCYVNNKKEINIKETNILTTAAENGHINILEYVKTNYGIYDNNNLFYAGVVNGSQNIIKYLIDNEINPDNLFQELSLEELSIQNSEMILPVMKFLKINYIPIEVIRDLIENEKIDNINALMNENYNFYVENNEIWGGSTIIYAAKKNKINIVKLLLSKNLGLNILEENFDEYSKEIKDFLLFFKSKKDLKLKLEKKLNCNVGKFKRIKI